MAKLYFRYGAMNAGKSTRIIQTAYNYHERDMRTYVMKPDIDTKGDGKIISRIGVTLDVDWFINPNDNLLDVFTEQHIHQPYHCVLIDEVQFLTPEQIDQLMLIATRVNVPVICYGLRTDFKGKGFPAASRLLEIAHDLEEIKTICECGRKAIFNARFVDGVVDNAGDTVVIDDKNNVEYVAMCATCYDRKVTQHEKHI